MSARERLIKKIVVVALLHHRVEVRQAPGLTEEGPQLANASHFGGFTDPLLLIHVMDRVPRFIAHDAIWKFPLIGRVLDWVGAIPVHKSKNGGRESNDEMFRSTYQALRDGDLVTIFPEGITVDDPRIAHIKTGSARIALGARASGVEGITLLSVGIHYGNKAALRSKIFIDIGYAVDLDDSIGDYVAPGEPEDASNRDAVVALTEDMEERLRWAAPDFKNWTTARNLSAAAAITLRPADGSEPNVGHGDRERLARLLDEASVARKRDVADAVDRYQSELDALGISDELLVDGLGSRRAFLWSVVKDLVVALILIPAVVIGAIANAIPLTIVWLIGRLKVADAMMATIKPIGAVVAFGLMWSFWAVRAWQILGIGRLAATLVLMPFYLYALIATAERISLLISALDALTKSKSITTSYDHMHEDRAAVVGAVVQAV